jgi:hypothetical protein
MRQHGARQLTSCQAIGFLWTSQQSQRRSAPARVIRQRESAARSTTAAPPTHNRAVALPPELLQAIAAEEGGKVALIVGAGCSFEPPTDLPLSRRLAEETHARLVADAVLGPGDCADPSDLSCVADAVFDKTNHQAALIDRFPLARLKNASPNDGYLLAVALLREHAIHDLLTLNFDLAARHALGTMNAGAEVGVVRGPADTGAVGVVNVIYLHRDVDAPPDEWILRTVQLEEAWRDGWEELITTRVMAAPVVVFAGLGTAAAVLVETIRRVRQALADQVSIHVDPSEFGTSEFTEALEVQEEHYVQSGWTDFMGELAGRVVVEQLARLRRATAEFEQQHDVPAEDHGPVFEVLEGLNLLELGLTRARWLLRHDRYRPARLIDVRLLADLVQGGSLLARELGVTFVADSEGRLQMRRDGQVLAVMVPASAGGALDWARFEAAAMGSPSLRAQTSTDPIVIVAGGVTGDRTAIAPPEDIIDEEDPENTAGGLVRPIIIDVNHLRADPAAALSPLR